MYRILFADLDGTLIQTKTGAKFAKGPWDWMLTPGIIEAIDRYQPTHLHIVSNQGGIARNLVKEDQWIAKVGRVLEKIHTGLIHCAPACSYDYCKTDDKSCPDRKPNPGMINKFLTGIPKEEIESILMIGDASGEPGDFLDSDKKAAENAKIPYLDILEFLEATWD
jgi:DNA 3'-phosphatase